jgi:hypothetical protein
MSVAIAVTDSAPKTIRFDVIARIPFPEAPVRGAILHFEHKKTKNDTHTIRTSDASLIRALILLQVAHSRSGNTDSPRRMPYAPTRLRGDASVSQVALHLGPTANNSPSASAFKLPTEMGSACNQPVRASGGV